MKRAAVGGGAYADQLGGFWVRPWVRGRRTWRKLQAKRLREAIKEANAEKFTPKTVTFRDLAARYAEDGYPTGKLVSRESNVAFCKAESQKLVKPVEYFGDTDAEDIRLRELPRYHKWRIRQIKRKGFSGDRTVDLELTTISNVLTYGVACGDLEFNYIRQGRPTYRTAENIRHCVECAPRSSDELHRIARHLLSWIRSQPAGWMTLFAAMTGCRRSELLRFRMDAGIEKASGKPEPGFIEGDTLYIRRSKRGVNPQISIGPELREMLEHFKVWHSQRYPDCKWFFPGEDGESCITKDAFARGLARTCEQLTLHRITPHGLRSFYVTKRRRDGANAETIAEEIGDRDVDLIRQVYGDFIRGNAISWLPSEGDPAWKCWS